MHRRAEGEHLVRVVLHRHLHPLDLLCHVHHVLMDELGSRLHLRSSFHRGTVALRQELRTYREDKAQESTDRGGSYRAYHLLSFFGAGSRETTPRIPLYFS